MTVDEALRYANDATKGATFYDEMRGPLLTMAVLAAEVRRLRKEKTENMAQISGLRVNSGDDFAQGFHRATVEALAILRGELCQK